MSDNSKHSIPARRGRRSGLCQCRAYSLTPEGEAATTPNAASPEGRPAPAPVAYPDRGAGHSHSTCPPSLRWLCEGRLPMGWIKEASRGTE